MDWGAYLAGYAVEIGLKAIISFKDFGGYFPLDAVHASSASEVFSHDFNYLLKTAHLDRQLRQSSNLELNINWKIVRTWKPSIRYRRLKKQEACDIFEVVSDRPNGMFAWLRVWA